SESLRSTIMRGTRGRSSSCESSAPVNLDHPSPSYPRRPALAPKKARRRVSAGASDVRRAASEHPIGPYGVNRTAKVSGQGPLHTGGGKDSAAQVVATKPDGTGARERVRLRVRLVAPRTVAAFDTR